MGDHNFSYITKLRGQNKKPCPHLQQQKQQQIENHLVDTSLDRQKKKGNEVEMKQEAPYCTAIRIHC